MSFSSEVKDELLNVSDTEATARAMGYGMLLCGRSFSKNEISLLTEHRGTADKYASVIGGFCGAEPEIIVTEGGKFKIVLSDKERISRIFTALEVIPGTMARRVNSGLLENSESCAAFLRGVFLVCGTVADPEKEYHLEFASPTGSLAKDLLTVFNSVGEELNLCPKITDRNGAHIVYLKKSENIEDTLAIMGAVNQSLAVMGAKVVKDIRNTVNRKVNFENANMARTVAASAKQYEAIEKLRDAGKLDSLPPQLREIAEIRLEGRELSSAEIIERLDKPLSVSGVNHRFAKLIKIAEEIN